MKLNRIKHKADVKAGNYIRAYLSPNGNVYVDYISLVGKPYKSKCKYNKGSWVINGGTDSLSMLFKKPWYFSSLSDELYPPVLVMNKGVVNKILVKYTPSAYNYLKQFSGNWQINNFLNCN